MIKQGDIYWVDFGTRRGSAPAFEHPCVVIQNDIFNKSSIATVTVCLITSTVRLAKAPGNVFLPKGKGRLPKDSVANISQIITLDKEELGKKTGHLPEKYFEKILAGVKLLITPV